LTWLWGQLIL